MIQILNYTEAAKAKILSRSMSNSGVEQAVAEIIAEVRRRGDDALRAYSEKFDRVQLDTFEVSEAEKAAARAAVSPELLAVMERAAENIRAYHEKQLRSSYMLTGEDGIVLGQRVIPLKRVGVYVPGGTASYPSTVLMDCIPAKLAGVGELIMVSPQAAQSAPSFLQRRSWPASTASSSSAARRRSPRWPMAPRACRAWTKSSGPAAHMSPRQKSRYLVRSPSI